MKRHVSRAVVFVVLLIAVTGCVSSVRAQEPPLDEQIKQKEAELKELKERRRQERIKQLRAELQQLEGGSDPANGSAPASSPSPAAAIDPPANPGSPNISSNATTTGPPPSASVSTTNAATSTTPLINLKLAAAPKELMKDLLPVLTACQVVLSSSTPGAFSRYEEALCGLARDIDRRKNGSVINTTPPRTVPGIPNAGISLSEDKGLLLPIMLGKLAKAEGKNSFTSFIMEADEARTDKQVGGSPATAGSTSLTTKGGVPSIFGWAVENGAATSSLDGTSLTFRFNPVGTVQALSGIGFLTGFRRAQNDSFLNFFRKTSVGLSFDTSRGDLPGTFTGRKQQLSAVSFRYEFVNDREPRLPKYQRQWEEFVATKGVAFAQVVYESTLAIQELTGTPGRRAFKFKDIALQSWLEQTNDLLATPGLRSEEIKQILIEQLDLLPIKNLSEETSNALTDFGTALVEYADAKNELLDRIAKGRVITFEYTNHRGVNAPDTSNFTFIAEQGTEGRLDFTFNGALTMFNRKPTGLNVKRIRDFQFSGQMDVPLGDPLGLGPTFLSVSGRYERLLQDATTPAGIVIPNTKGDLGFGQAKLTIPIKGTGVKIPFSFTFSNRTELITEREVRGNFGLTLDLDTLMAKFKPF